MDEERLLRSAEKIFERESRFVELFGEGEVVFAGDIHGDLEATQKLLNTYWRPQQYLIFLGDYVDRGPHSLETLQLLLALKLKYPDRVFLLQGNHEGYAINPFSPAEFWESLNPERRELYARVLGRLPLAVSMPNGILALHGALPNIEALSQIRTIKPGSELWRQLVWGDWQESRGFYLGEWAGRPQFGQEYFEALMERFGKRVLIRSHQPTAPLFLYGKRCVTILTSSAYGSQPRLTRASLNWEVHTAEDLQILEI